MLGEKNNHLFFIIFWIISQSFDQMITMWHSGYGDTPLGTYLSKNIQMLKSYPQKSHFVIFIFGKHRQEVSTTKLTI